MNLVSTFRQFFPPRSEFSVDDIPDLTGRIAIVTGGNAGIGKETIKALLQHNATVYMASRSKNKAEQAISELKQETGKTALFLELDLASLESVERAAVQFKQQSPKLHMLFNSGGVMNPPVEQLTVDGYDLQFGVNVLGHFYLTKLLLSVLLETARTSPAGHVRIINVSSLGHMYQTLDFSTFREAPERTQLGTRRLYFQSKFGSVVFSNELARRYGDEGIVSVSLNPGNLKTELHRHSGIAQYIITTLLCYPAPYGALTSLWAGTTEEGAKLNGKYLIPWARIGEAREEANDVAVGKKLWEWLEQQVEGR